MAFTAEYHIAIDSWFLAYAPGGDTEVVFSDGEAVPDGDWVAFVSPYHVSSNTAVGLVLAHEDGSYTELLTHANPPLNTEDTFFVKFPGRQFPLRVEYINGTLILSYSVDSLAWTEVARFERAVPVSELGVVLRYDFPGHTAQGQLSAARLIAGQWENALEEVVLGAPQAPPVSDPLPPAPGVTMTSEPLVHAVIGAQFGDLEFDVGKSVRWVSWFTDNVFVLDVNLGTPRYWIVNWTETFPNAKHSVTGINFFYNRANAAKFRAEQWKQYKLAFGEPHDDDWIIFVDAHEGMGVDNRSLPDDYDFAPFKSFLWREIQRAQDLSESSVVLPYYVFLRSGNIVNVTYTQQFQSDDVEPVLQAISVPRYHPYQGLRRIWNAAALKAPDFDWTQLDVVEAPSAEAKLQIISYGYAHWNLQDIEPPATTVPPLTEENDDGWRMRNLLSRIRPIPGLPYGDEWVESDVGPSGREGEGLPHDEILPGPWAPADFNNPEPIDPDTGDVMVQQPPADPSLLGLVTPLYDCVFRINMRDGVWYEEGLSGNIPLVWDEEAQDWTTNYDPALWAEQGVDSYDPSAVP